MYYHGVFRQRLDKVEDERPSTKQKEEQLTGDALVME